MLLVVQLTDLCMCSVVEGCAVRASSALCMTGTVCGRLSCTTEECRRAVAL